MEQEKGKIVGITEFTMIEIKLKNASKAELMKRIEDELSEFETTQIFELVQIVGRLGIEMPLPNAEQ